MRKFLLPITLLGLLFVAVHATPAQAQATRTWVSGVGDDVNPCSRTAPCKTFAGAISKTASPGEINCLDSGGFGTLTITKSITIKCEGVLAGVLASGGINGFTINDSGSATPGTAKVTISGIDIEGEGVTLGLNGVSFVSGAELHLHKVQIRNFSGNGVSVTPSSGSKKITITDSYITNVGSSVSNAGILVRPTAGASVNVNVNNTQFESAFNGIFMDGSGGGGVSHVNVKDSVITGSSNSGIVASSTGSAFTGVVANSILSFNSNTGAAVAGASGSLRLGGNTITNNVTGVSNSGGSLLSFKNNQIVDNGVDGTPITAVNSGGLILN
jgi:hypothetical protein